MKDTKFMSAAEKEKVLRQWELFLKSGLNKEKFTKSLYHHLIQHCEFIAHYDINGFFDEYFTSGDTIASFMSQFDNRNGLPQSIEYGGTGWLTWSSTEEYHDINHAMVEVARKYVPGILQSAKACQRNSDIMQAQMLLAKHGIKMEAKG
jgi:hypothetical protein